MQSDGRHRIERPDASLVRRAEVGVLRCCKRIHDIVRSEGVAKPEGMAEFVKNDLVERRSSRSAIDRTAGRRHQCKITWIF